MIWNGLFEQLNNFIIIRVLKRFIFVHDHSRLHFFRTRNTFFFISILFLYLNFFWSLQRHVFIYSKRRLQWALIQTKTIDFYDLDYLITFHDLLLNLRFETVHLITVNLKWVSFSPHQNVQIKSALGKLLQLSPTNYIFVHQYQHLSVIYS